MKQARLGTLAGRGDPAEPRPRELLLHGRQEGGGSFMPAGLEPQTPNPNLPGFYGLALSLFAQEENQN